MLNDRSISGEFRAFLLNQKQRLLFGLGEEKYVAPIDGNSLTLTIDMTIQSVLNYCNISELPSELNYVVCLITAETYKELNSKFESGNVVGNISSISEGGRTVSFTNGSEFKIAVEDKISRMTELNRYRKLYRL